MTHRTDAIKALIERIEAETDRAGNDNSMLNLTAAERDLLVVALWQAFYTERK